MSVDMKTAQKSGLLSTPSNLETPQQKSFCNIIVFLMLTTHFRSGENRRSKDQYIYYL